LALGACTVKLMSGDNRVAPRLGPAFGSGARPRPRAPPDRGVESPGVPAGGPLIVARALPYQPLRFADALRGDHTGHPAEAPEDSFILRDHLFGRGCNQVLRTSSQILQSGITGPHIPGLLPRAAFGLPLDHLRQLGSPTGN